MARAMKDSGIAWIGEIPAEWEVKKLKFCSSFMQDKYDDDHGFLPYIGMENIVSWNGKYITTESQYDKTQSLIFRKNDILWGKLRPYLAKVYHCNDDGCCSSEFCVIRIDNEYNVRYFWNLLISSEFVATIDQSTYGTKMPRANADFIRNVSIPIPPIAEQNRIASYLDAECARIDAVIEQTRASIEEYKKLKQAVITQAVTKGIRPNRPMKDSGVNWIGMVPDDWDCTLLKRHCAFQTGSTPSTANEQWFNGDLDWFTPADFNEKYYLIDSSRKLSLLAREDGVATMIPQNTVMIIGIGGTAGKIGYTTKECSCNQQITAIKADDAVCPKYLMYWMIANTTRLKDTALYTTLPIINNQTIGQYPFLVPATMEEQVEIADYLDSKVFEIETLIEKTEKIILDIEKYKKSLIFEYITGRKEVM